MIRKDVYLTSQQVTSLESLGGPLAQHIRNAVDSYLKRKIKFGVSASKKGGVSNG